MYKVTKLSNGLTVASHHMAGAYSVSVGIWFRVGSRYEDNPRAGISHLLEHMIFKGSPTYSTDAIKRRIEGSGGQLNGFTSEELTCYLAKVPHKMVRTAFTILNDIALYPSLKPAELKKEKTVIIEEIKMYNDLPEHMAQEQLDQLLWPGHPLGRNIAGSIETVSSTSREELARFQKEYYKPSTMLIVFTGNIHHDDCMRLVNESLKGKKETAACRDFTRFSSTQNKPMIKPFIKEIEQTRLAIGFCAYERMHPKRFAVSLLSVILGGNMSSRLFDKVREKHGLAYAISAHYKRLMDTGAFYILAGLDNRKVDLALRLILQELSVVKNRPVPEAELRRAKEFVLSQLAMSLEDTLEHMVFLGEAVATTQQAQDYGYIKKEVEAITPATIQGVARDIFRAEKANISLVGTVKDFDAVRCGSLLREKLG